MNRTKNMKINVKKDFPLRRLHRCRVKMFKTEILKKDTKKYCKIITSDESKKKNIHKVLEVRAREMR